MLCDTAVSLPLSVYLLHLPRLDGSFGVTTGHASPVLGQREVAGSMTMRGLRALVNYGP